MNNRSLLLKEAPREDWLELIPVSLKLSAPGGVAIVWNDGHRATYSHAHLRKRCPCATCERSAPNVVEEEAGSLPIFGQEPIRAVRASQVGHYAIQFDFSDGHKAGIYAFSYLREICPCPECAGSSEPHGRGKQPTIEPSGT